jgi:hypothetical protein
MRVRDKNTGDIIELGEGAHEVLNAFIVPLQCFYKKDYELVDEEIKEKK